MRSNASAKSVLRAVADGKTLTEAGTSIGVGVGRARQLLNKICRELKLPNGVSEIRRHKEEYFQLIGKLENSALIQINPKIAENLARALGLKKLDDLTPKYLSNISAAQLLNVNLTLVAVAEAQEWLVRHGMSLKRRPPENGVELQAVQRAISTLDAFQFDTSLVRSQFCHLQGSNG